MGKCLSFIFIVFCFFVSFLQVFNITRLDRKVYFQNKYIYFLYKENYFSRRLNFVVYASTNQIVYGKGEKMFFILFYMKRSHISIYIRGKIDRNKLSVLFLSGNCVQGKFIWILIRDFSLFFFFNSTPKVIYLYFKYFISSTILHYFNFIFIKTNFG